MLISPKAAAPEVPCFLSAKLSDLAACLGNFSLENIERCHLINLLGLSYQLTQDILVRVFCLCSFSSLVPSLHTLPFGTLIPAGSSDFFENNPSEVLRKYLVTIVCVCNRICYIYIKKSNISGTRITPTNIPQ